MRKEQKEDAVSPVIGVMLMLVVTVIIAAVVSVFATGLFTEQDPSSNVVIQLSNHEVTKQSGDTYNFSTMTFTHRGGDVLEISNLKLALTYGGDTYTFYVGDLWSKYPASASANPSLGSSEFADLRNWEPGEKITLDKFPDLFTNSGNYGYTTIADDWKNMNAKGSFDWSIVDATGYTIAAGTADVL